MPSPPPPPQKKKKKNSHVAANSIHLKNIKYLKVYMTQRWFHDICWAPSKWRGKCICLYMQMKDMETSFWANTLLHSVFRVSLMLQWRGRKNKIKNRGYYSGSSIGPATWQQDLDWDPRDPPLSATVWGNVLTQNLCTSKQNYNVPTVEKWRRRRIE